MSITIDRLANEIKRHLSMLLINGVKDSKIGYITVTDVKLTNDLSYAYVYFTIIGNEDRIQVTLDALNRAKGYLKKEIAQKVKMRKVPEFIFKYDDALENGNKIEKIINELK